MPDIGQMQRRRPRLFKAFENDGFKVKEAVFTDSGMTGIRAEHTTAKNYDTGKSKASYYVEGTPYERGFLLGQLAEPEISDMTETFVDNVVFDFIGADFLNNFPFLQDLVVDLVHEFSQSTWKSQPRHVRDEARGLLDGCRKADPDTRVTESRVSLLNIGIDVLCALAYTGRFLKILSPQMEPEHVRLPILCNAFSVFGSEAGGGHYFARDLMFPTGRVLQNNLAHIIHVPRNGRGADDETYPYVSVAAPGMLGSLSAMNGRGVAAGLNMCASANSDPARVGMNSMLLLRECVMRGQSAAGAADVIQDADRGVSWNYILSDGSTDTACTVEAGASWPNVDFLGFPPKTLLPFLPDEAFLSAHPSAPLRRGAMVRWCNAPFPDDYMKFNAGLWAHYNAEYGARIRLYDDALSPGGYIDRTLSDRNCPLSFYFAPQRTGANVLITANQFLYPHMRLCAMLPWTARLLHGYADDIQWRYDEFNHRIREALEKYGSIDYESAKGIADLLAPYGEFPFYYKNNPKSRDGMATVIKGCTSLFDLKKRTVESHYGYYSDEWVRTSLDPYVM
jgi:hypothetical protein